ncbi:dihydrofolate reductase family protein [Streptomyces sp. NPDC012888]|uniref:dihydrofolate reductase family protein n=1 Tax=Streptomyces sp. NPDC012888 TaxID=3364855 RepID=UPI003699031E
MGKLTLTSFVTLDGVMQAPGGPDEDRSGGFEYGGWLAPYADDQMIGFMTEVFDRADAFLLGRRTYDIFAAYWPSHEEPGDPISSGLNSLPKYVASTTLKDPDWARTTVLDGEQLQSEIVRVKDTLPEDRELQVHGSGMLAQYLLARDLVEEINLLVYPVFLGAGRRLFPTGGLPTAFELVAHRMTDSGTSIHTYRPTGRATFATIGE